MAHENSSIDKPEIVETQSAPVAALYAKIPVTEIRTQMGLLLTELSDELRSQGIKPTGPWFTHHFRRPDEFFDFEVCFPVATPIKANGRVKPSEWPATKMVRTTYRGGYDGLVGGWQAFMAEIESMGLEISPEIWEVYLVGPDTSSNSEDWRTQLNRPVIK